MNKYTAGYNKRALEEKSGIYTQWRRKAQQVVGQGEGELVYMHVDVGKQPGSSWRQ